MQTAWTELLWLMQQEEILKKAYEKHIADNDNWTRYQENSDMSKWYIEILIEKYDKFSKIKKQRFEKSFERYNINKKKDMLLLTFLEIKEHFTDAINIELFFNKDTVKKWGVTYDMYIQMVEQYQNIDKEKELQNLWTEIDVYSQYASKNNITKIIPMSANDFNKNFPGEYNKNIYNWRNGNLVIPKKFCTVVYSDGHIQHIMFDKKIDPNSTYSKPNRKTILMHQNDVKHNNKNNNWELFSGITFGYAYTNENGHIIIENEAGRIINTISSEKFKAAENAYNKATIDTYDNKMTGILHTFESVNNELLDFTNALKKYDSWWMFSSVFKSDAGIDEESAKKAIEGIKNFSYRIPNMKKSLPEWKSAKAELIKIQRANMGWLKNEFEQGIDGMIVTFDSMIAFFEEKNGVSSADQLVADVSKINTNDTFRSALKDFLEKDAIKILFALWIAVAAICLAGVTAWGSLGMLLVAMIWAGWWMVGYRLWTKINEIRMNTYNDRFSDGVLQFEDKTDVELVLQWKIPVDVFFKDLLIEFALGTITTFAFMGAGKVLGNLITKSGNKTLIFLQKGISKLMLNNEIPASTKNAVNSFGDDFMREFGQEIRQESNEWFWENLGKSIGEWWFWWPLLGWMATMMSCMSGPSYASISTNFDIWWGTTKKYRDQKTLTTKNTYNAKYVWKTTEIIQYYKSLEYNLVSDTDGKIVVEKKTSNQDEIITNKDGTKMIDTHRIEFIPSKASVWLNNSELVFSKFGMTVNHQSANNEVVSNDPVWLMILKFEIETNWLWTVTINPDGSAKFVSGKQVVNIVPSRTISPAKIGMIYTQNINLKTNSSAQSQVTTNTETNTETTPNPTPETEAKVTTEQRNIELQPKFEHMWNLQEIYNQRLETELEWKRESEKETITTEFNIRWNVTLDYFSGKNTVKFKWENWLENWNIQDYWKNLLWEKLYKTQESKLFFEQLQKYMFYQHLDNPLKYCSHWFDHSILVDAYVQNVIKWTPEVVDKMMSEYNLNREWAILALRLTAIFHDFWYPNVWTLAKSMHWPFGWQLFINEFANTEWWKDSFTKLFSKYFWVTESNMNDLTTNMRDAIFFHSADKVESWYLNKVKYTKWEFLVWNNMNDMNHFLEILDKWWDLEISYRNPVLVEGKSFTDNNWKTFKVLSIDWDIVVAEYKTKDSKKTENKNLKKSDVEWRLNNTMLESKRNAEFLEKKLIEEFKVDPDRIKVKEDNTWYDYDSEFSSDRYQWRKADKKRWDAWIEFKPIDLLSDPLAWIVRLADNMDMSLDRLTEIQWNPVFMNLLYNLWFVQNIDNSASNIFQRMEKVNKMKKKFKEMKWPDTIEWLQNQINEIEGKVNVPELILDYEQSGIKPDLLVQIGNARSKLKFINEYNLLITDIQQSINKWVIINNFDYKTWTKKWDIRVNLDNNIISDVFKNSKITDWNIDVNPYKLFIVDQMAKYYNMESDPNLEAIKNVAVEDDTWSYSFRHFAWLTSIKDVSLGAWKMTVKVDPQVFFNSDLSSQSVEEWIDIKLNEYHIWRLYDASGRVLVNKEIINIEIVDLDWNPIWYTKRSSAVDDFKIHYDTDYKKPKPKDKEKW